MPDFSQAPPKDPSIFDEWYFLACLTRQPSFFYRYCQHINRGWRSRPNFRFKDFTNAYGNNIYDVLCMYYMAAPMANPCSMACFAVGLQGQVAMGLLLQGELQAVYDIVQKLYSIPESDLPSLTAYFNEDVVAKWLSRRRGTQIINFQGQTMLDLEKLRVTMDQESEHLGTENLRPVVFGNTLDSAQLTNNPVILTPWAKLNQCIYGFMPGDYQVIGSAQSGGKTIVALQWGGYFARNLGLNTIIVSTEQSVSELEARMVSNYASVPITQIVGGLHAGALDAAQLARANEFRKLTLGKLFWVDWSREFAADAQKLGSLLDSYKRDLGLEFQVLIFDFIGGGIGDLSGNQLQFYRLKMQQTSDYLATLARQNNMCVIATAQVDPKIGYRKRRIDMMDLSENKTLTKRAANFLGLSALKDDAENSTGTFQTYQYLYCGKPRKGPGGEVKLKREMIYQRFVEA